MKKGVVALIGIAVMGWAGSTIGVGMYATPVYDGLSDRVMSPIPLVNYHGPMWFATTSNGFLEGGIETQVSSSLTLAAQVAYEGGRLASDSAWLREHGIASIDPTFSYGMQMRLASAMGIVPVWWIARYRQHAQHGALGDVRVVMGVVDTHGLQAAIYLQNTWARASWYDAYYGVHTSWGEYTPSGGALFRSGGLLWAYALGGRWKLSGSLEARQLASEARMSPLTPRDKSHYVSVGIGYTF